MPRFAHNDVCAFTLAEVLITLVIIGVIAALTVPTLIAKYTEQQTVARVKKAYSTVAQAWQKYQVDYACTGKFSNCIQANDSDTNMNFNNRFLKYFSNIKIVNTNESMANLSWLPDDCYGIDGIKRTEYWYGIHKNTRSTHNSVFTLNDGMIFLIVVPDPQYKQSGLIWFDTNGKKAPNRVGKDQFVIGIGARDNKQYEAKVHPYYNEDNESLKYGGLCNIRQNNICNPDVCIKTSCSPTAYVLKNNKLPPINW